jgi:hypothetical protein
MRGSTRRLALAQHRHVEPALQREQVVGLDPPEEVEVGGAAAQRDVLAVVEPQPVALERERRAAELARAS